MMEQDDMGVFLYARVTYDEPEGKVSFLYSMTSEKDNMLAHVQELLQKEISFTVQFTDK